MASGTGLPVKGNVKQEDAAGSASGNSAGSLPGNKLAAKLEAAMQAVKAKKKSQRAAQEQGKALLALELKDERNRQAWYKLGKEPPSIEQAGQDAADLELGHGEHAPDIKPESTKNLVPFEVVSVEPAGNAIEPASADDQHAATEPHFSNAGGTIGTIYARDKDGN